MNEWEAERAKRDAEVIKVAQGRIGEGKGVTERPPALRVELERLHKATAVLEDALSLLAEKAELVCTPAPEVNALVDHDSPGPQEPPSRLTAEVMWARGKLDALGVRVRDLTARLEI